MINPLGISCRSVREHHSWLGLLTAGEVPSVLWEVTRRKEVFWLDPARIFSPISKVCGAVSIGDVPSASERQPRATAMAYVGFGSNQHLKQIPHAWYYDFCLSLTGSTVSPNVLTWFYTYIQYNIAYTPNPLICIICNFILPGQHGAYLHSKSYLYAHRGAALTPIPIHKEASLQYRGGPFKEMILLPPQQSGCWNERQWQPQVDMMAWKELTMGTYRQLVTADRRLFGLQQGEVPNWLSSTKWSLESYTPAVLNGLSRWYLYIHEYM